MKDILDELLKNGSFGSIEELNKKAAELMNRQNAMAQVDFLGLSSDQMHRLLHFTYENTGDMVRLNPAMEREALDTVPIVNDIKLFLTTLDELEPLKCTAKGFLPIRVARLLHHSLYSRGHIGTIRSEEESPHLHTLRLILEMCGWIKKRKKAFSLTAKGRKVLAKGFDGAAYLELFKVYTRKFNWAFQDGFEPLGIIQHGFLFSFIILKKFANDFISPNELGDRFIYAFPMVLEEIEPNAYREPSETLAHVFSLRFLERFCEYFGLVEIRREKKKEGYGHDLFVKTTDFYDAFFEWTPEI